MDELGPLLIVCPDCGKHVAFEGRCPKCGGDSWIPAGKARSGGRKEIEKMDESKEFKRGEGQTAAPGRVDFTRATKLTPDVEAAIDDAFEYHPWTPEQVAAGKEVRIALASAVKVIVENVPPGPDRTVAIRKIREARMDCNSSITHGGKY